MEIMDYYKQECNVIVEPQSENHMAIMTTDEMKRTESNNFVLFTGTFEQCEQFIQYPVQDPVWPSRKWNTAKTDYIDLSGE